MQASNIPAYKFPIVWAVDASAGFVNYPIPNVTATPGQASLELGFPPDTFEPTGAGGIPPFGADFNGAMEMITSWTQWFNAGGVLIPYDPAFATAIGGYPKGSLLASASFGSAWLNEVDNNATNPDSGGTNWQQLILPNLSGTDTGTANALVVTLPVTGPAIGGFSGFTIKIRKGSQTNTGACTLNLNGFGAIAIIHPDGSSLGAGELPSGGYLSVIYDGTHFQLQSSSASNALLPIARVTFSTSGGSATITKAVNVSSVTRDSNGVWNIQLANVGSVSNAYGVGSAVFTSGSGHPGSVAPTSMVSGTNPGMTWQFVDNAGNLNDPVAATCLIFA